MTKFLSGLRRKLREESDSEESQAPAKINPANVIWVLGAVRTGSSWLTFMMRDLPGHSRWNEPLVGNLFGSLYYDRGAHRRDRTRGGINHFVLGNEHRTVWVLLIRSFIIDSAAARFPERAEQGYLVIKEPHGSIGAPLLMEALPESRMVFLVRDPRDVAASAMDAQRKGGWARRQSMESGASNHGLIDESPDAFVEMRAQDYLQNIQNTKRAYDAHEGRKTLVRYEDLRADTLGTMKRIYADLGILVDEAELYRVVDKHSWENVPEEEKGEGKIRRKAKPGGWREDLTEEQIETVERITAPLIGEFYS